MDRDQEQSSSTPKAAKESAQKDKISKVYQKNSMVRLTPTKFQVLVEEFSDIETEETDSDVDSQLFDTETASEDELNNEESEDSDGDTETRTIPAIRNRAECSYRTKSTPPTNDGND